MEIVQLSDIHVGSQFREETFQKVIDEINSEIDLKLFIFRVTCKLNHNQVANF